MFAQFGMGCKNSGGTMKKDDSRIRTEQLKGESWLTRLPQLLES